MKRKYPKTEGYFVYAHTTPNGLYYVGMSKQQPRKRWNKSAYKEPNSLAPYISEYGWENIQHKVLIDGLTKEQAEAWEDRIIQALSMNGMCINKHRSGGLCRDDRQAYHKQYSKQHNKQCRSTPEGKIYNRVAAYNHYHPDKAIETPMEAREKYLETCYIPAYIKHDDLI